MARSLDALRTDYVDLYHIHWPSPDWDFAATLEALVGLQEAGLARAIGVANFPLALLRSAVEERQVPIACLQVEYHAMLGQQALLRYARAHDIALTAYSPLGRGEVATSPVVAAIAAGHDATPTQVALAWLLAQDGVAAVPKAAGRANQLSNLQSLQLRLTEEERARHQRAAERSPDRRPGFRARVGPAMTPWSDRLDALLGEADIDALLVTSKHNIRYLLDGHHHHFFAHTDAIGISRYLPILIYARGRPEDSAYIANRNERDALAVRTKAGRPLWVPTVVPGASGSAEAMGLAVRHLRGLGLDGARIGVEMPFLPADAFCVLREGCEAATIVEAHRPLELLRAVKTPAELGMLRDASDRVVDAMLAAIGGSGPGKTKREFVAALQHEEARRGLVFEYALVTVGRSHVRAPSDERWEAGQVLSVDSGGHLDGYIGDLCRMGILGEPDGELRDLLGAVDSVQMAARIPIRAGVLGRDIYEAARAALAGSAWPGMAFVAHGMGLIGHEVPRLTSAGPIPYPDSDAGLPLEAGMVVSIETTLAHPERGFIKLEDTVAVTQTGWDAFGDRGRGWNRGAA